MICRSSGFRRWISLERRKLVAQAKNLRWSRHVRTESRIETRKAMSSAILAELADEVSRDTPLAIFVQHRGYGLDRRGLAGKPTIVLKDEVLTIGRSG